VAEKLERIPFWEINFDQVGQRTGSGTATLLAELPRRRLTDLFIFSHGWNNTPAYARKLSARLFGQIAAVLRDPKVDARSEFKMGTASIIWPSIQWADEEASPAATGGAVAVSTTGRTKQKGVSKRKLVESLKTVYRTKAQRNALKELVELIDMRPSEEAALDRFQALLRPLVSDPEATADPEEDALGEVLLNQDSREVFAAFADAAPWRKEFGDDIGGATGLRDFFDRAWDGAFDALRAATYWQMKRRAGVVGLKGLGPLLGEIRAKQPELRLHLIGHSFGARLVSFSLAVLSKSDLTPRSPVKSLSLLQGAFSHFAFASRLRHDPRRGGALSGMAKRVDGPILVTFSEHDTAVGNLYPMASLAARDDAAKIDDLMDRWQAMGYDGAQEVGAKTKVIGPVGTTYPIAAGRFVNLDGNDLIVEGSWPSGAHGDIIHPEIAWAVIAAAGLA
jgi:hypothetical protein